MVREMIREERTRNSPGLLVPSAMLILFFGVLEPMAAHAEYVGARLDHWRRQVVWPMRVMKRSRIRRRSFSERYPPDHPGPAYGPLFRVLRDAAREGLCALCELGYSGPGHRIGGCAFGELGFTTPTAHHMDKQGHIDVRGLLPVGGAGHMLLHNRHGRRAQEHFNVFLKLNKINLSLLALEYVERTRGELP